MTVIKGDAYILRTCKADMTGHGGFVWPREGKVEAPDWLPTTECGNGLHGFLWGDGCGDLAGWSDGAVWIVARVSEWIDLGDKVKFPRAEVVFAGDRNDATQEIIRLGARGAVIGAVVAAGDWGTATAGEEGTATAGDWGTATAGEEGTATAGDWGTATAGDWGTATAGYRGTATAGDCGAATAGEEGTATAGDWGTATAGDRGTATAGDWGTATAGDRGILQISYWDGRCRIATAYVGENGIKPNKLYRLNRHHKFEEVTQ